jgi:hypothetical protein
MEDAHQEISEKLDKELNRYIGQYASLFILNEELELMLKSDSLKKQSVDSLTVITWLTRLQEIVREGMQHPTAPTQ